jgi:hypothetical protein
MAISPETQLLERISQKLSASVRRVFSPADLVSFLDDLRLEGVLPKSPSTQKLQQLVIDAGFQSGFAEGTRLLPVARHGDVSPQSCGLRTCLECSSRFNYEIVPKTPQERRA